MKIRLEQITDGEEEVVIRYRRMTKTIQDITETLSRHSGKILGHSNQGNRYLLLDEILYLESVDGRTFAYTTDNVYQVGQRLKDWSTAYGHCGFFRCAKGMIVNIYRIAHFQSQSFGRIEATLDNDEKIIISRKFAGSLRQLLQEGIQDEN